MRTHSILGIGLLFIPSLLSAATVLVDDTPTLSAFGLDDGTGTANNQTSDYFGVGIIDPVGMTRWAIASTMATPLDSIPTPPLAQQSQHQLRTL